MSTADAGVTNKNAGSSLATWLNSWLVDLPRRAMAICLMVGLFVSLVLALPVPPIAGLLHDQELDLQDRFFSLRYKLNGRPRSLGDEIILVCVDSDSMRRLGMQPDEPLPRRVLALLMKQLEEAGAQVIGLDLPLEGEGANVSPAAVRIEGFSANWPGVSDDMALANQLQDARNVVLSSMVDPESRVRTGIYKMPNAPFVEALGVDSGSVGNALIQPDADGQVRHLPLVFEQFKGAAYFYKSFALRIAEKQMDFKSLVDTPPDRLWLRKHVYPTVLHLNFIGPNGSFKMIPLWRALEWRKHVLHHGLFLTPTETDSGATGSADLSAVELSSVNPFRNKIVLVGAVSNASENRAAGTNQSTEGSQTAGLSFATPVSQANIPMSAVEVQATAISNVLHERNLNDLDVPTNIFLVVLLSLLFGKFLGKLQGRPWISLSMMLGFSLIWFLGAFLSFSVAHTLIPIVVPICTVALPCWALVVADAQAFARREKRRRTRVFRSLAAKPLAQEIERRLLAELGLEGKRMTVTVLACQMRGFGEQDDEPPEAVMQRLNSCLSVMMACVGDYHGLVERIWNCGIIAMWGAPIAMAEEKQAKMAIECALAMRKRLFDLHDSTGADSSLSFNFTCGINTGDSICGTINATARDTSLTQYGALGSAVDFAVELETLNPSYGTTFMLGPATAALVQESFEVREIDRLKLGRRETAQSIYELLPWEGSLPGALEEAMALFKQGRGALEEGRVQEAEQLFSTSLRMVPHDKPTMIMLDRCREIIGKAPGQATELVQKLTLKKRLSDDP